MSIRDKKYAVQVNGVTELIMMKADVLSGFKTLKVCTAYNYKGKEISHLPFNIEPENVTPIYKSFKGCLLYPSDAADDLLCSYLGGCRRR